jgi:hypothetical protein
MGHSEVDGYKSERNRHREAETERCGAMNRMQN